MACAGNQHSADGVRQFAGDGAAANCCFHPSGEPVKKAISRKGPVAGKTGTAGGPA